MQTGARALDRRGTDGSVAPGVTISVVVPTYHRPELLQRAVSSVLRQELPSGTNLEVVIAVSDPDAPSDIGAAHALAAKDDRVRVVLARRPGPGAARNVGMAAARGEVLALLDDDCQAEPGWLAAGVAQLEEVDLVQGKTMPGDPITHPYDKTIWVLRLSGLWESCNLFVRREVIDRHGGFDEEWNPTGTAGQHWGEDTEWGWRLVRGGATHSFEPEARVQHAVFPQTLREWVRYETKVRYFPMMVRSMPELREAFLFDRYFFSKRHRTLTAAAGVLGVAAVARLFGWKRGARGLLVLAAAPVSSAHVRNALPALEKEWLHFGALVYGSVKYRRVVL